MDETPGNTPQKLRNARACEACRASKSRCFFKTAEHKTCQRCEQTGGECIVRTKARPMRARAARPPNNSTHNISPRVNAPEFTINLPSVSCPNSIKDVQELHDHHKQFFEEDNPELESAASDDMPSQINQRKLTLKEAEELLLAFRGKSSLFPFVVLQPEATVPFLARHSPFLLLAILAASATSDPMLRRQLDHEFKRILSAKVIVGGQKSLDFLQGLIVYIAWYPLHSKPKNSQAFMYVNLASGLALDLGLDRGVPSSNFTVSNTAGLFENGEFSQAAKRAYLGSYYVSAGLSTGYGRPNNVPWRNLMDDFGQSLLQSEVANDVTALVSLQHLAETIANFHRTKTIPMNDPIAAEVNSQMFQNDLQVWRQGVPDEVRSFVNIALLERFVGIHIYSHELGFLMRPYRDFFKQVESTASLAHLQACLTACKAFFEYLLQIPESHYRLFTAFQWALMVQSTLILSRLSFVLASRSGWDAATTRANVPMGMYLDALCFRFQSTSATPSNNGIPPKNPDMLYVFYLILSSVKRSYNRRVDKIEPKVFNPELSTSTGPARGHCPVLDPGLSEYFDVDEFSSEGNWGFGNANGIGSRVSGMDFDVGYGGAFGMGVDTPSTGSGLSTNANIGGLYGSGVLYHDLWATMTGSWAEEI